MACVKIANDERLLIEIACGVFLVPVYDGRLRKYLDKNMTDDEWKQMNIVIKICGGNNYSSFSFT